MIPPGKPEPNYSRPGSSSHTADGHVSWRNELRTAIRSAAELCDLLGLRDTEFLQTIDDENPFPVLVPRSFAARMRHGDPQDPLLLQVLAQQSENSVVPGYSVDPLNEVPVAASGILRKYARRALLIATAACPVHCRYCFRRHFPYADQLATRDRWAHALRSLRESPEVEEVILSGGDPLSLSTVRLTELIDALEQIDSITTLRIHTRFPIVLPSRVTESLLALLHKTHLKTVVVLHCNHANELRDSRVTAALQSLHGCVDLLLSQSVLLRGINDCAESLRELSSALFRAGVAPYYLHMPDRVAGSAHFDVPEDTARSLINRLRDELPGYLVPALVREVPGALSKTPVQ